MNAENPMKASLPQGLIARAVQLALDEDLGRAGDVTSQATLGAKQTATAVIDARESCTVSGMAFARMAFKLVGDETQFTALAQDGQHVEAGAHLAKIEGNAQQILAGERVALNFLNHMCAIATHTRCFVDAIGDHSTKICDTRKTTPGLRAVEKYAVRCGGGANHRMGLDDAILIKDNHIAIAGSVSAAVAGAKDFAGHLLAIEVEVDTVSQFKDALAAGATAVLLDNMDNETLSKCVKINAGRAQLEASGGVDLDRVRGIAQTGVDYISTSKITMGAPPVDIGLDIEIAR